MKAGSLEILNVGAGDVKITFDKDDAAEAIRAKRIIKDMLRRGYALLVQGKNGKFSRVKAFDAKTSEYVIADYDPDLGEANGARAVERRVPMAKTKTVAVGRSAGG